MKQKRLIVSGLSGGSGKTLASLALSRTFLNLGENIQPFKKGPDYIDTAWLSLAAKKKAYNLDPFFLDSKALQEHFLKACTKQEHCFAFVEGNRGLFDGKDVQGSASTAELAALLELPIILTINAQKCTRTLAAIVNGVLNFDKRLSFLGLIFNNVASSRHEKIIHDCVKEYCDTDIIGFIPRFNANPLPERHLGLSLDIERHENEEAIENIANKVKENLDISAVLAKVELLEALSFAKTKENFDAPEISLEKSSNKATNIGYIHDKVLWFYYSENLEALENAGANLIKLSLSSLENWDKIDALYIGGGYPELYAEEISSLPTMKKIKEYADKNMPIYAECGGFMLLTKSIASVDNKQYSMANIFDIELYFHKKPQGLGYIEAEVVQENPYFTKNSFIKGHEFHYTLSKKHECNSYFSLSKGMGMGNSQDALMYKNVFACYTHLYALANPEWAVNFVALAKKYKEQTL